jgi:hypothetical protein
MQSNFTDVSTVEKYIMPETEYEQLTDSVLAWKKRQHLGRFDPNAPSLEEQKVKAGEREVEERGKLIRFLFVYYALSTIIQRSRISPPEFTSRLPLGMH